MILSRIVQICRKLFTCYPTCFTTALESYSSSTDLVLPNQWAVVVASVEISPISTGQEYKPVHLELVTVSDGNFIQVFSYQIGKKKKLGPKNITFHVGVNFRIERQEIERARCQNDKFFNILGLILESLSNCWHPWHS